MSTPKICARAPEILEMETGTYWWCSCGYSSTQPFCDGAHKDKGFKPLKVGIAEKKKVAWCLCKHTSTPPYCDGSHARLC